MFYTMVFIPLYHLNLVITVFHCSKYIHDHLLFLYVQYCNWVYCINLPYHIGYKKDTICVCSLFALSFHFQCSMINWSHFYIQHIYGQCLYSNTWHSSTGIFRTIILWRFDWRDVVWIHSRSFFENELQIWHIIVERYLNHICPLSAIQLQSHFFITQFIQHDIDGLVQDCSNSSVLAMELL